LTPGIVKPKGVAFPIDVLGIKLDEWRMYMGMYVCMYMQIRCDFWVKGTYRQLFCLGIHKIT
jgi:hypothetical protein